jgi:pyruvate dehydrogenase E2 component (dihydrolipoamide acetyltransferase)
VLVAKRLLEGQLVTVETIKIPDIGGSTDVEVIEVCVAVGDVIKAEQSLIVLESDKASMEIPSPKAGKVVALKIAVGKTANAGDVILELEVEGAAANKEAKPAVAPAVSVPAPAPVAAPAPTPAVASATSLSPSPSVQLINIPEIGTDDAVDLIEISVRIGDAIKEGDSLIVLETDKASMEVPSPIAGIVQSILVKEGSKVKKGDAILEVLVKGAAPAAVASAPQTASASVPQPIHVPETTPVTGISDSRPSGDVYAGPAVRKLAREFGIDLAHVKAAGPRGRIQKEDLQDFVKQAVQQHAGAASVGTASVGASGGAGIPPIPAVDFAQFGAINVEPMSKIAKVTAANMHRAWLNVPHVTQFDDVDITDLEDFRNSIKSEMDARKIKLTPLPFLLKACCAALLAHPKFNSSLSADGESLVYKKYVHIGIAVDTPAGLMVPVIRDVDKKGIWELAQEASDLAARAKDRKLKPEEMKGGCFSISSLGNMGGTGFTPIINAPEVAILGVSKLDVKPVWNGKEFLPRKMLPLTLSYDHRVINGADAGRFFTFLNAMLVDIRKLVL